MPIIPSTHIQYVTAEAQKKLLPLLEQITQLPAWQGSHPSGGRSEEALAREALLLVRALTELTYLEDEIRGAISVLGRS